MTASRLCGRPSFERRGDLRVGERIGHADRVPRGDALRQAAGGEEGGEVVRREVGRQPGGDAGEVGAERVEHAHARRAAERIEHGAVGERQPVAGDEAVEAGLFGLGVVDRKDRRVEGEGRRRGTMGEEETARADERGAELVEILLVGKRRILVEPLGRQKFGRLADRRPAVDRHLGAHENLWRFRQRTRAELERDAERRRPLEEVDGANGDGRRRHPRPALRPAM